MDVALIWYNECMFVANWFDPIFRYPRKRVVWIFFFLQWLLPFYHPMKQERKTFYCLSLFTVYVFLRHIQSDPWSAPLDRLIEVDDGLDFFHIFPKQQNTKKSAALWQNVSISQMLIKFIHKIKNYPGTNFKKKGGGDINILRLVISNRHILLYNRILKI
jgi:hypothetical protein